MPIPLFNAHGLLPPGIYPATFEELAGRLGFSPKRQDMIEHGLRPVLEQLRTVGVRVMYVDGSFTTCKPSPGDIDGYVLTTVGSTLEADLVEHQEERKAVHRVDLWPAYTDEQGEMSQAWWEERFGHTTDKPLKAKGMIQLILGR